MKKLAKIAMVASALAFPYAANAAPADGTYVGTVTVSKGLTFDCTLTAVVSNGGTKTTLSLSPGNFLCAAVFFNNQPYSTSSTGTTSGTYTISGIHVTTITPGDCVGTASGTYNGTTLNVSATLPPSTPGTGTCSINGTLTKVS